MIPELGNGFSVRNLSRMVRFAEVFPEGEIVVTLSRQLSWSKSFTKRLNWRGSGWRQNLRSAGDTTPAIKYPKNRNPGKCAGCHRIKYGAGLSRPA